MKKLFTLIAAAMLCVGAQAQSVNIHLTNGKSIGFSGSEVQYVDFNETNAASSGTFWIKFKGCSVYWASRNIGAENDYDYGKFFTWGEADGFSPISYDGDYNFYPQNREFKEQNIISFVDGAQKNWGNPWTVPSVKDVNDLLNNTQSYYTTYQNTGITGRWFVGINAETNKPDSIFFPAAAQLIYDKWTEVGRFGCYWAKEQADKEHGNGLFFGTEPDNSYRIYNAELKWHGLPIRAVRSTK